MANSYNAEVGRIHLERLGRRVIEARVHARREADRRRRIVRCVYDHIHSSPAELHERLDNIMSEDRFGPDVLEEVEAEIAKLR